MQKFGIDVSVYQGDFDFELAKKQGVEFVIIKCGGGDSNGGLYKDSRFESHYQKAKKAGLGVGAYFFAGATTVAKAKEEAKFTAEILKGKQFDYPIFYDVEWERINITFTNNTEVTRAYMTTLEGLGYWVGFYTNLNWFNVRLNGAELAKRFSFWLAEWSKTMASVPNVQMWQFGGEINYIRGNTVAGVVCDQDYCFVDYPAKIKAKGLNGYPKQAVKKPATTSNNGKNTAEKKKTVLELAKEVIAGKWGNGLARKQALEKAGYDYKKVQAKVDELMKVK